MAADGNSRSMESRVGRDKQRYSVNKERMIAGVVPLNDAKDQVLLIQSTRRKGWVLPKGGWELDEATAKEAAAREAWEEAGIDVHVDLDLGETPGPAYKARDKKKDPAIYHFYQVTVTRVAEVWPEMDKRNRKWFSIPDALAALQDRPELHGALCRAMEGPGRLGSPGSPGSVLSGSGNVLGGGGSMLDGYSPITEGIQPAAAAGFSQP